MKNTTFLITWTFVLLAGRAPAQEVPRFRDLFNGRDLSGWVNVNTAKDTWKVRDGVLVCSGRPDGFVRTDKQYENFILHLEWKHTETAGNSGLFVWSQGTPWGDKPFPTGCEIQMLEVGWTTAKLDKDGKPRLAAYVHGELIPVNGLKMVADNPRGNRSMSVENRCKPKGEWNTYEVVCVAGDLKLAVNGKFVNGMTKSSLRKGYICLESEGAEIHFRNIRIMELPSGLATSEQTAAVVGK